MPCPRFSLVALALVVVAGCGDHPPAVEPQTAPAPAPAQTIVARVDAAIAKAWRDAGITPAPAVDDATFLRRVSLDLTGTIPDAAAVRAFLDDRRPDKRERAVAELVASDAYARHWAGYWDDVLMGGVGKNRFVDRVAFRQWLYQQIAAAVPWDEMVRRLVTASGVNSSGGRPDPEGWELGPTSAPPEGVDGAVNWLLRGAKEPQDVAGTAARVFLGVRLQCAECHDHPTERWKQEDFRRFTAAFMRVEGRRLDRGKQKGIRRIEVRDVDEPTRQMRRRMEATGFDDGKPTALDGSSLDGPSPRAALAAWMTRPDNPWFARALVNRMWGRLLGSGFVEPVDDFRDRQEIAAPEVLDALVADFTGHGYDLRRLTQSICATQAYQRAAAPAADAALWSRFALRPMTDVELLDVLVGSSGLGPVLEEVAGERLAQLKLRLRRSFRFTFDVDEESSVDAFTGTVPQALMLLNGPVAAAATSALEGSAVGRAAALDDAAAIEHLYLAALSRPPDPEELAYWQHYLSDPPPREGGRVGEGGRTPLSRIYKKKQIANLGTREHALEDLLWALYNSSEFYFVH